jgi:subtilase family serine protease
MFDHEHFTATTGKPPPAPSRVYIDGGAPFDPASDGSFEASLDVQQVIGGAPGAAVTIVDIPDLSDASILDGYNYIVNAANAHGAPYFQLVNSSFGECELFYSAAYNDGEDFTFILGYYNELFEQGNAEGITFVASSGDSGGLECPDTNYFALPVNGVSQSAPSRFLPGVEFPASSPFVTAVGGTNLITTYQPPSLNSAYVSEAGRGRVWRLLGRRRRQVGLFRRPAVSDAGRHRLDIPNDAGRRHAGRRLPGRHRNHALRDEPQLCPHLSRRDDLWRDRNLRRVT